MCRHIGTQCYVGVSFVFREAFYEVERQDHNYIYFPSFEEWQRVKVVYSPEPLETRISISSIYSQEST